MALTLNGIDKAFPTIVRYAGLITTLVLVGFCLAGFYVQAAPGFVAAASMLLYKTVRNAAQESEEEKNERSRGKDLSDW